MGSWGAALGWWIGSLILHQPLQGLYRDVDSVAPGLVQLGRPVGVVLVLVGGGLWLRRVSRVRGAVGVGITLLILGILGVLVSAGATAGELLHTLQYGVLAGLLGGDRRAVGLTLLAAGADEGIEWWRGGVGFDHGDCALDGIGAALVYLGQGPRPPEPPAPIYRGHPSK